MIWDLSLSPLGTEGADLSTSVSPGWLFATAGQGTGALSSYLSPAVFDASVTLSGLCTPVQPRTNNDVFALPASSPLFGSVSGGACQEHPRTNGAVCIDFSGQILSVQAASSCYKALFP